MSSANEIMKENVVLQTTLDQLLYQVGQLKNQLAENREKFDRLRSSPFYKGIHTDNYYIYTTCGRLVALTGNNAGKLYAQLGNPPCSSAHVQVLPEDVRLT
jgi:hypothetical protein